MTTHPPPTPATPRPDAPLDVAALPAYWDAQRAKDGKPDASTCAAELRRALEAAAPTPDDAAIRAKCEVVLALDAKATQGPWERWDEHTEVHACVSVNEPSRIKSKLGSVADCDPDDLNDYEDDGSFDAEEQAEANSELIARYRTAAPDLARELLRRLDAEAAYRAQNDQLRALLKRTQAYYREPNSDHMEFTCNACQVRSRYGDKHADDCLTIAIIRALADHPERSGAGGE